MSTDVGTEGGGGTVPGAAVGSLGRSYIRPSYIRNNDTTGLWWRIDRPHDAVKDLPLLRRAAICSPVIGTPVGVALADDPS